MCIGKHHCGRLTLAAVRSLNRPAKNANANERAAIVTNVVVIISHMHIEEEQ